MEEKKRKRKKIIIILSIILVVCSPCILCIGWAVFDLFISPIIWNVDSEGAKELREVYGISLPDNYEFVEGYEDVWHINKSKYELHFILPKDSFKEIFGSEWYPEGYKEYTDKINFMKKTVVVSGEYYVSKRNSLDRAYYREDGNKIHMYFEVYGNLKYIK